jgi:hypothetical protein
MKDHCRNAIHAISGRSEVVVYTATGWRRLPTGWAFLHAGGAIGADGPVEGVEVRLPPELHKIRLPAVADADQLRVAVIKQLELLHLGPHRIMVSLLGSIYAVVAGLEPNFSLHIEGRTQIFKTALAVIGMHHVGVGFAENVGDCASWFSTVNQIELLAHFAKDVPLLVDDLKLGENETMRTALGKAERFFVAVANRAGRGRLDRNAQLRPTRGPRALPLSTGEAMPKGVSNRARVLILTMRPGDLTAAKLNDAQTAAAAGAFAMATTGFVQWVARRYADMRAYREVRDPAKDDGMNRRAPDTLAYIRRGWNLYLEFAQETGAITEVEGDLYRAHVEPALEQIAGEQRGLAAEEKPVPRFFRLLQSAINAGRAHVAGMKGTAPKDYGAWAGLSKAVNMVCRRWRVSAPRAT